MNKTFLTGFLALCFAGGSFAQTKVVVIPLGDSPSIASPTVPGYILGRSDQTSNGRFTFQGENGTSAATEMCKASYPDDPTAHLCNHSEIQNALATDQFDVENLNNINTTTWTLNTGGADQGAFSGSLRNSCWNFTYNSGDAATGTRVVIAIDDVSPGNGGGVAANTFNIESGIGCNTNYSVMCCR